MYLPEGCFVTYDNATQYIKSAQQSAAKEDWDQVWYELLIAYEIVDRLNNGDSA